MLKSGSSQALEILVVDDDRIVSLLHKNQLRASGIDQPPVLCSDGKEALEYLIKNDQEDKNFLILLDLNMPVMNGWKFLKNLRKQKFKASVNIVVVTSSIFSKDESKALRHEEVVGFFKKPLCAEQITIIKEVEQLKPFFYNNFPSARTH